MAAVPSWARALGSRLVDGLSTAIAIKAAGPSCPACPACAPSLVCPAAAAPGASPVCDCRGPEVGYPAIWVAIAFAAGVLFGLATLSLVLACARCCCFRGSKRAHWVPLTRPLLEDGASSAAWRR